VTHLVEEPSKQQSLMDPGRAAYYAKISDSSVDYN